VLVCTALVLAVPAVRIARADDEPLPRNHMLELVGGIGYTFSNKDMPNGSGDGGMLSAEYVFRPLTAISPRLYGGVLMTFPQGGSCVTPSLCDVESKLAFAGAKLRLMAPIPWVGPFLELGVGLSAGYMRTLDGADIDEKTSGIAYHIPVSLGLAIGRNHEYD